MILYVENPKDSTKKLIELIHELSTVTGYKINAQKRVAFLYSNNKAAEREIKEFDPIYNCTKTRKITRNKSNHTGEKAIH